MLVSLVGTVCAEYGIKSRLPLADIKEGDLVVIEAASTVNNYGYYIKDAGSTVAWKQDLDESSVWKVHVAEGGMRYANGNGRKFYFENVATGNYISSNTDGQLTVAEKATATPIAMYPCHYPWNYSDYDNQKTNTRGWDLLSVAINAEPENATADNWLRNDPGNRNEGVLNGSSGTHNFAWNIYAAAEAGSAEDVTPFNEINAGETKSDIEIDNIFYTLYAKTPNKYAMITSGNQQKDVEELFIPANVEYEEASYRVVGMPLKSTFQGGKFSKLEFESPTNLLDLGDWDFAQCDNVVEITLPEGITTLTANRAFGVMASLEKVVLPTTITKVGDYTFSADPKLTTVIFKGENSPSFGKTNTFGDGTIPANITIVVPSVAAIEKYKTALQNANIAPESFKEIITLAQYEEQLLGKNLSALKKAAEFGVGRVNGIKDEASMSAVQDLLAGSPSEEEVLYALENYVLKLENGYYRVIFPCDYKGPSGNDYLRFGADKWLYADCDESDLTDYSTVFKAEVISDNESKPTDTEYKFTLTSQNLRPTDTGFDTQQAMGEPGSQHVYAACPDNTYYYLVLSTAEGTYTNNRYLYKKPATEDKKIYTTGSQAGSGVCYLVPATEIAIELHQSGDNYWATINVPFGITLPEGTEAYVGKVEDDNFMLTSIGQEVPAGTPVILCGDSESITAQITDNAQPSTADNDLSGIYLADTDANDGILTLGEHNGQIGFYKSAFALGANKAYLNAPVAAGSNGFKIVFDDSDLTGIGTATADAEADNAALYDLYGRKVTNPVKGNLYIKNGKVIKQ